MTKSVVNLYGVSNYFCHLVILVVANKWQNIFNYMYCKELFSKHVAKYKNHNKFVFLMKHLIFLKLCCIIELWQG